MTRRGLATIVLTLSLLVAACSVPAPLTREAPPPMPAAPVENLSPQPAPGYVWVPGAYAWHSGNRAYVWVPGHWTVPPSGHVWIPGHWETRAAGTVWVDGQWRRI